MQRHNGSPTPEAQTFMKKAMQVKIQYTRVFRSTAQCDFLNSHKF